MTVVVGLAGGVDAHPCIKPDRLPRCGLGGDLDRARRGASPDSAPESAFIASARPSIEKTSSPVSPSDSALCPSGNCSGSTPIPTRFERWMRSNDSTITARTPSRRVPLAAQSREEPDPYSAPPSTTSGTPSAM